MQDIIQKFRFQHTARILNAPEAMMAAFQSLGFQTVFDPTEKSTNTLVFINSDAAYLERCVTVRLIQLGSRGRQRAAQNHGLQFTANGHLQS
ncbi:hypothetical protein [Larkinella sp. C7]|uniref:hypothetical protein n=1 Tax=Larkinella sp. C7 TaxID=2576607 RepID=UPI00111113F6|nr:hypothetical protein [Larkinella sp. C7]